MTIKSAIIATSIGALCLSLGACASTGPATPHAAVMPGPGKSYAAFQRDDAYCQNQAQAAIGGQSPGQAANDAAVGSAVVGTALGAAAGAALGSAWHRPGTGAAVGAGEGLVVGSAIGAGNGRAAGAEVQGRFDRVYSQCMAAKGNDVGGYGPGPGPGYGPGPAYGPGPGYGPGPAPARPMAMAAPAPTDELIRLALMARVALAMGAPRFGDGPFPDRARSVSASLFCPDAGAS